MLLVLTFLTFLAVIASGVALIGVLQDIGANASLLGFKFIQQIALIGVQPENCC